MNRVPVAVFAGHKGIVGVAAVELRGLSRDMRMMM